MRQIKTIAISSNVKEFDSQVNTALEDGFVLVRRYATNLSLTYGGPNSAPEPSGVYYAELEKETEAEKPARKRTAKE